MLIRFFAITIVSLMISTLQVHAGDEALYPSVPGPNDGFLRIVSLSNAPVSIQGREVLSSGAGISAYYILPAGKVAVRVGATQMTTDVIAGAHRTLFIDAQGGENILNDVLLGQPGKADVTLINATDAKTVSLFVPRANTDILSSIPPVQSASVAIRAPLTLGFEINSGSETLAVVAEQELERRRGLSILLYAQAGKFHTVAAENTYEK